MLGELFDPKAEFFVERQSRPHWTQAGAIVFVTFRTADSIPASVLGRWDREKCDWLSSQGFDSTRHWTELIESLDETMLGRFHRRFNRCREDYLDGCHGECPLRQPDVAAIVRDFLLFFDGVRYRMGDFVVMPNHVHLLASFATPEQMRKQFDSWLHYSARQINLKIGQHGHFWQKEPFDHLVRSVEQYEYLRRYIFENPKKAHLPGGDYLYYRREP